MNKFVFSVCQDLFSVCVCVCVCVCVYVCVYLVCESVSIIGNLYTPSPPSPPPPSLSREMCVSRTSNDGRTPIHKCTNICTVRPVSEGYRTRVAGGGSSKTEHTLQNRAATAPMLQHTSGMNERVCIHACVGLSAEGLGYAYM